MALKNEKLRWVLTDHACRNCGGRVMQSASNVVTGGGNPLYQCADCEQGGAGTGPSVICWCGYNQRGNWGDYPYTCVHMDEAKKSRALYYALTANGFNPDSQKTRVGCVSVDSVRRYQERLDQEDRNDSGA